MPEAPQFSIVTAEMPLPFAGRRDSLTPGWLRSGSKIK
jgi:hypothetical protein